MKLILSPAAILDLQSISAYTLQHWGTEQEEIYLKDLWRKLTTIQSAPESYRIRKDLAKRCRAARHEKHIIFFTVHGEILQVIRILHASADFNRHLISDTNLD
jgi:toxin ParE1/3/4